MTSTKCTTIQNARVEPLFGSRRRSRWRRRHGLLKLPTNTSRTLGGSSGARNVQHPFIFLTPCFLTFCPHFTFQCHFEFKTRKPEMIAFDAHRNLLFYITFAVLVSLVQTPCSLYDLCRINKLANSQHSQALFSVEKSRRGDIMSWDVST